MTTDQPTPTPVKRSRAARRVSVLFATIENLSFFYLPTRKGPLMKLSFCTARPCPKKIQCSADWKATTPWEFINPFRSVLVDRPKESAFLKAWTGILRGDTFPKGTGEAIRPSLLGPVGVAGPLGPDDSALANSGRTHYEGDDCPGGHADVSACIKADLKRRDAIILKALSPHNDNNITGPTC